MIDEAITVTTKERKPNQVFFPFLGKTVDEFDETETLNILSLLELYVDQQFSNQVTEFGDKLTDKVNFERNTLGRILQNLAYYLYYWPSKFDAEVLTELSQTISTAQTQVGRSMAEQYSLAMTEGVLTEITMTNTALGAIFANINLALQLAIKKQIHDNRA